MADIITSLGVFDQIRLVAELRWRILRNLVRKKNSRLDLIGLVFAAIFSSVVVIGLCFAFWWGAYFSISTGHYGWLLLLFWGIFFFWQAFPLFVAGFGAPFEFRTLLRFPLSLQRLLHHRLGVRLGRLRSRLRSLLAFISGRRRCNREAISASPGSAGSAALHLDEYHIRAPSRFVA